MVAGRNDSEASEAADVAESQGRAVGEFEPGPGVVVDLTRCLDGQLARHPQMNDEFVVVVEPQDQVLAATADRLDGRSDRFHCVLELLGRERPGIDDRATGETGLELTADRFDLGKFGHLRTAG